MGTYLTVQEFSEDRMLGIGAAVSLAQDANSSYIEVPSTTRHYYEAALPLLIENEDGYQEEAVVSSVVYGTGDTDHRINLTEALSDETKFTTAKSAFVKVNQYFHALTIPSSSTIERWILAAESRIDLHCHTSWKSKAWEGWLAFDPEIVRMYYGDFSNRYAMKLPYSSVTTPLDSNEGDQLKYWDGVQEVDCLSAGWTYGRASDYWIAEGWLFFRKRKPRISRTSVYIDFRYDQGTVPDDIKEACSKLVAREYLRNNPRTTEGQGKPATGEQWPYIQGTPSWAEVKGILKPHVMNVFGV